MQNVKWIGCWVWIVVAASGSMAAGPYLQQMTITGKVEGMMARSTINLLAANPTTSQRSGAFEIRLPRSVAVDLAIWIDGVRIPGEVEPKVRAEQIYGKIVATQKDPAILRQVAPGVYQLDIFPIPSRGTMRVEVSFVHLLNASKGKVRYVPPYIESTSMFGTLVLANRTIQHRSAPAVVLQNKHCDYTKQDAPIWKSTSYPMKGEPVAVADAPSDGLRSFVFQKSIKLTLPAPTRPTVILVDASQSMGDEGVRIACVTSERILASRKAVDPLKLVVLQGGDVLTYDLGTVKSGSAKFKEILSKLKPIGGTDFLGGVTAGVALAGDDPKAELFLITDGEGGISYHQDPLEPFRPLLPRKGHFHGTIHVFSPGCIPWASRRLAKHTRGLARNYIGIKANLNEAMEKIETRENKRLRHKEAKQFIASLQPANKQTTLVDKAIHVRPTTDGVWVMMTGRAGGPGELQWGMKRTDGVDVVATEQISLSKGAPSPKRWVESLQGRYWVEDRFRWLRKKEAEQSDYKTFNKLMELAWQLHIVTKCTSMLALENDAMYMDNEVRRHRTVDPSESAWSRSAKAIAAQLTPGQIAQERRLQTTEVNELRRKVREAQESSQHDRAQALATKLAAALNRTDLKWAESVQKQWRVLRADQAAEHHAPDVELLLGPLEGVGIVSSLARKRRPMRPKQSVFGLQSTDADLRAYLNIHAIERKVPMSSGLLAAVNNLSKQSTVPIKLNWNSICNDYPDMENAEWNDTLSGTLSDGLQTMVSKARAEGADIAWRIIDGEVVIDSRRQLDGQLVTRVYQLEDFIRRTQYLTNRYTPEPPQNRSSGGGLFSDEGGTFGDSGQAEDGELLEGDGDSEEYWRQPDMSAGEAAFWGRDGEDVPLTPSEMSMRLQEILRQAVANDSWYPNGTATMNSFGDALLITHTSKHHQAIERILAMIRKANPNPSGPINVMSVEDLFDRYRRLRPWVATLLAKAREGKLGKYSSIKTRTVGKTIYARIGGVWMDTKLETGALLIAIEPESLAGTLVIPLLPIGDNIRTFGPLVIHAIDGQRGYAMEGGGLSHAKDTRFAPLLKAIQAEAAKRKAAQK
jgi:hypothetical protein